MNSNIDYETLQLLQNLFTSVSIETKIEFCKNNQMLLASLTNTNKPPQSKHVQFIKTDFSEN